MDFNQPHNYRSQNTTFNTFQFTVAGAYTNIVRLLHHLEQKNRFGEVIHITFETKRNYRTRVKSLEATIFIQHIN